MVTKLPRELGNQALQSFSFTLPTYDHHERVVEMESVLSADKEIVCSSKRKKKRFCDHCDRLVSIRTFNVHKQRKTVDHANSSKCDCE